MRQAAGLSITRFCALAGIHRSTWHRWAARERGGRPLRGPWPRPVRERISEPARELALRWPAWGHRKIWALLAADGHAASPATVERALRDHVLYADGVGPSKDYVVERDGSGASQGATSFVADAHDAGLLVHPYTFRNENSFLPFELRAGSDPALYGDAMPEYEQFFGLGVDGVFSDNPDTAVEVRGELE